MEQLNRQTAIDFYNLYYTPNNAILVVAGDVTEDEVKALAEETYGKVARRAEPPKRVRPSEPPQRTARTLVLRNERVTQPSVSRSYVTPSDITATNGESEALELLSYILGAGTNSRLYQSLVVDQKIATSAGSYYQSDGLDDTRFVFYGTPTEGHTVDEVLDGIKAEIAKFIDEGVTKNDVVRAKRALLARTFYAQDNQASLARLVGSSLAIGYDLDRIRSWPERLAAVGPDQVVDVAKRYLQDNRSVTGFLLPPEVVLSQATAPAGEQAGEQADESKPVSHGLGMPKDAPRASKGVPAPKSRPQGQPKPKPDETAPSSADPAPTAPDQSDDGQTPATKG